jgi:hypothetical protein
VLEAAWWGFVGGAALLIGAAMGIFLPVRGRVIGLVMAFGSGVLISALSFELVEEAYAESGGLAVVLGLLSGSLAFFVGDCYRPAWRSPPESPTGPQAGAAAGAILGAPSTASPERGGRGEPVGGGVGVAFVAAVFLSTCPRRSIDGVKAAGQAAVTSSASERRSPWRRRSPRPPIRVPGRSARPDGRGRPTRNGAILTMPPTRCSPRPSTARARWWCRGARFTVAFLISAG